MREIGEWSVQVVYRKVGGWRSTLFSSIIFSPRINLASSHSTTFNFCSSCSQTNSLTSNIPPFWAPCRSNLLIIPGIVVSEGGGFLEEDDLFFSPLFIFGL